MRYTGKPLLMAGSPESMDVKRMMLWGNLIDAEKAIREGRFGDKDAPSLVPRTWQLIRQRDGSQPEVVTEVVLSFDLAADGAIVYTNGSAIYQLTPDGITERLAIAALIEQVSVIG